MKTERVELVRLPLLSPFPGHPFLVRDDGEMDRLTESIRQVGVLVPAIAKRQEDGTLQLISGHRRKRACELLGVEAMPVILREVDLNTATVMMVDSNLQREIILPSEKARAYKMKLEAIRRQGARTDLTSVQTGQRLKGKTARERIAENSPDSATQIQRYIRMNELLSELLRMVDEGRLALTPAVELSYLSAEEQTNLLRTIDSEQATPSLSQAQRMRKLSMEGRLTDDAILSIMLEQKKPECWNLSFPMEQIARFFPSSYTPKRMQETILQLLERWQRVQQTKNQ